MGLAGAVPDDKPWGGNRSAVRASEVGPPDKHATAKRQYEALLGTWEWNFEKTVEKVEAAKARCNLTGYTSSDIYDFADRAREIDPSGVMVAFLPFYKGGYEKLLYKKLDEILAWESPSYEIIDKTRKARIVEKLQGFDHVIIDDVEHPGSSLVMLKRGKTGKMVYLYSNMENLAKVYVRAQANFQPVYHKLATAEDLDAVTEETPIVFAAAPSKEINFYRYRFLAKTIDPCDGVWNWYVFVGGKLLGFIIAAPSKYGQDDCIYIMSDFCVDLPQRLRASKLLLLLMQTHEFRELLQDKKLSPVNQLYTTAFTDKPVSMKYRGVWELAKRGKDHSGKPFLNYQTETGKHSIREAVIRWSRNYRTSST